MKYLNIVTKQIETDISNVIENYKLLYNFINSLSMTEYLYIKYIYSEMRFLQHIILKMPMAMKIKSNTLTKILSLYQVYIYIIIILYINRFLILNICSHSQMSLHHQFHSI